MSARLKRSSTGALTHTEVSIDITEWLTRSEHRASMAQSICTPPSGTVAEPLRRRRRPILAEVAGSRSDSAASVFMRRYERGVDGSWHEGLLMDLLAADLFE
jgi:hypothetical protein